MPWDVLGDLFLTADHITYIKLLRIVKVLKLFRVTRMAKALRQWEDVLDFQYNITINEYSVKMIKLAGIIFTVIHVNACTLFLVPSLLDFPGHFPKESSNYLITGPSWPYLRNLTNAEPHVQYSWAGNASLKLSH